MDTTTTRRAALKLTGGALAYAAGAGAFAVATTATSSCTAKAADRSAWDRAYAALERVKAADAQIDAHHTTVYDAYKADIAKLPPLPMKDFPFRRENEVLSLDMDKYEREWFELRGKAWWGDEAVARKYRDTFKQVRRIQAERARIERKHNMNAIEKRWDESGVVVGDAEWALFNTPAPDAAAIEWKIAHLLNAGIVIDDDLAQTIYADLRHLQSKGA